LVRGQPARPLRSTPKKRRTCFWLLQSARRDAPPWNPQAPPTPYPATPGRRVPLTRTTPPSRSTGQATTKPRSTRPTTSGSNSAAPSTASGNDKAPTPRTMQTTARDDPEPPRRMWPKPCWSNSTSRPAPAKPKASSSSSRRNRAARTRSAPRRSNAATTTTTSSLSSRPCARDAANSVAPHKAGLAVDGTGRPTSPKANYETTKLRDYETVKRTGIRPAWEHLVSTFGTTTGRILDRTVLGSSHDAETQAFEDALGPGSVPEPRVGHRGCRGSLP